MSPCNIAGQWPSPPPGEHTRTGAGRTGSREHERQRRSLRLRPQEGTETRSDHRPSPGRAIARQASRSSSPTSGSSTASTHAPPMLSTCPRSTSSRYGITTPSSGSSSGSWRYTGRSPPWRRIAWITTSTIFRSQAGVIQGFPGIRRSRDHVVQAFAVEVVIDIIQNY